MEVFLYCLTILMKMKLNMQEPWEIKTDDNRKVDTKNVFIIYCCLLYTSDAADERSSVDLGGRRIIKKKKKT